MVPCLTGVDVLGVQRFVFASNRLRDVVGASHLVHEATSRAGEAIATLAPPGQVLVATGGNAVLEFTGVDGEREARGFAARYSRWLLERAPGLEVAVAHHPYAQGELAAALRALQVRLERAKVERVPSVPLGGLGVTASCRQTGGPAAGVDTDDPSVPLSAAMLAARAGRERAAARWQPFLGRATAALRVPGSVDFPDELEEFRSRGELSMVAIAHLDGNGVGVRIASLLRDFEEQGLPDGQVRERYQAVSRALEGSAEAAFTAVAERAAGALAPGEGMWGGRVVVRGAEPRLTFAAPDRWPDHDRPPHGPEPPPRLLPVRPVLLGGDDLTFMADARVALNLAETGLAAFERATEEVGDLVGGPLHACAGVAIVGAHAPILRAYELAEQLCRSAKRLVRDRGVQASALDWHIGAVRPGERVERLRERQYRAGTAGTLELTCRPYLLGSAAAPGTWRWLAAELLGRDARGSLRGPGWGEHRSKVKQLERLAREGPTALGGTLEVWRAVTPELAPPGGLDEGYLDERTPLLDAVELVDLHLPLEPAAPVPPEGGDAA